MNPRYVVKVRRFYQGREATSVLCAPTTKEEAETMLLRLSTTYQSTQYYLEKWEEA